MDSGNSGSLQSSSDGGGAGDDEYADSSTTASISAFLTRSAPHHMPPPSSSHYLQPSSSSLFDPLSSYFDVFSRSTPSTHSISPLNLDTQAWSTPFPSQPISTTTATTAVPFMASSAGNTNAPCIIATPSFLLPRGLDTNTTSTPTILTDQTAAPRPSKKRSRASRRAPTTVLTTDTSNFRAMVQEFTGIPAPPFSASPQFPRSSTRFDLFNNQAISRPGHLEPPPYLLRPFPHKVHPPPFLTCAATHINIGTTTTTTSNSIPTSNCFDKLVSELGVSKESMQQQPMVPPRYQQSNSLGFGESSQDPLISSHVRSMVGFSQGDGANEQPSFVSVSQRDDPSFNQRYATNSQQQVVRPPGASSSSANHEKDQNVISRSANTGEGMVDSWICSSD